LAPGVQLIEALFGFTGGASVFGVHVDAKGATIDLRSAKFDEMEQFGVNAAAGEVAFDGKQRVQRFASKFLVVNSFFHFGGPFLPARIGCEKENGRHRSEGTRERRCGQLATSAIFADSLVHQGVKFRTRESDFVGSVLTVVASFGKLGTSSGRRSDV